jgi:hypothetical protein
MARKANFLIFGTVVSVAAVAVYTLSGDAPGEQPSVEGSPAGRARGGATERSDAALRAELNALQRTVQQLSRSSAGLRQDVDVAITTRDASEEAQAQAAAAARLASEDPSAGDREAAELASRCDAKISSEPVDPEWSRAKSNEFDVFFARAPLVGTKLKAADCRTTMCRIDIAHNSSDDRARFIQSFSDLAGPTGMVFAQIEAPNDLDVVVYVTRDGIDLP